MKKLYLSIYSYQSVITQWKITGFKNKFLQNLMSSW